MKKEEKYYGIYFNKDIPKIEKVNQYSKEVEIKFEGKAFLVKRRKGKIIEKVEIQNFHKLKKQTCYEIEFENLKGEIYNLRIKLKSSLVVLWIILIFIGFLAFLLNKSINGEKSAFARFCDYINLSILPLHVENKQEMNDFIENKYEFDVSLKKTSTREIDLFQTIYVESIAHYKILPGNRGSFSLIIDAQKSKMDRKYRVEFEDLNEQKPSNMLFKIRGDSSIYQDLKQLSKKLNGTIQKFTKQDIIIDWQWAYETGEDENAILENDKIDTKQGERLNCYKFKVIVRAEEVEK